MFDQKLYCYDYLDSTLLMYFLFFISQTYTRITLSLLISSFESCDMVLEFQPVDVEILPLSVPLCGAVYYFV